MGMFANLGRTLSLLRELRGRSQTRVAREARIGKSQLSKYENGKELPKFETLEKILHVLKVDMFEFFYTLYLVDGRAAALAHAANIASIAGDRGAAGAAAAELSPAGSSQAVSSSASSASLADGDSGRGPASAATGGTPDGTGAGGAGGAAGAALAGSGAGGGAGELAPGPLYLPPLPHQHPLLAEATDQAFARVFSDLLMLYRRVFEQVVLSGGGRPDNAKV